MNHPAPLYESGDPVGWLASRRHDAGSGIITRVIVDEDGRISYDVHRLIAGEATGVTLTLQEEFIYPTRGLRDVRPQPAVHRDRG